VKTDNSAALARCRTGLAVATLGASAALVVACGGTTSAHTISLPTLPGLASAPSNTPGPTSGNLGDTLAMEDGGGVTAHVTLVKVFDPATGFDPNTTPPDGTRWVGFELTIVVPGTRSGQDATSVDVIGSDGQTYGSDTSYDIGAFDGCVATDITTIAPGATQTACWGVGLPPGVTVAKVGYSTYGVAEGEPAALVWTVADSSTSTPTATPSPTADDSTPTASPSPSPSASASPDDATTTPTPSPSPTPS
jgi:hypothetical protein